MAFRSTKQQMTFKANFSQVESVIGALSAFANVKDNESYLDDVIYVGFSHGNSAFNREAAAYASAGGNIKHMFEWGTPGINKGRTNVRSNPLSEKARLWHPVLKGFGLKQEFDFTFKPSVAFVPKPTTKESGMDTETISKLRDHVFYNKAMVMETGMTVTIRPVEAQFLLFPMSKGKVPAGARTNDVKRGYTINPGPVNLRPGAKSAGNFTTFWTNFWNDEGEKIINESVVSQLKEDFYIPIFKPRNSNGQFRKIMPGEIKAHIKEEQKRISNEVKTKSSARRKEFEIK